MQRKFVIGAVTFAALLAVTSFLLVDAETLNARELALLTHVEEAMAQQLAEPTESLFPAAARITNKVHVGGSDPFIYKLTGTSGRPGKRVTMVYTLKRTEEKAKGRFRGQWKHELRANSLGLLEAVDLGDSVPPDTRLATIRAGDGNVVGMFFLARSKRGIFSMVLKGIVVDDVAGFADAMGPTLQFLSRHGHTLMNDENP